MVNITDSMTVREAATALWEVQSMTVGDKRDAQLMRNALRAKIRLSEIAGGERFRRHVLATIGRV